MDGRPRTRGSRVVAHLELSWLPFQITANPERNMVEKHSPYLPDQALDEWVEERHRIRRLSIDRR